jgi:peptide-methionine (R)-S-oxide reductase
MRYDKLMNTQLSDAQRSVLAGATEAPWSGLYVDCHDEGTYRCVGCNTPVFSSTTKFESGSGWPSFTAPIADDAVERIDDRSFGMHRVEVRCGNCHGHLGHVFDDGPRAAGGQRYCINSLALDLDRQP